MPDARVVIMGHCTIDDIHQPDGCFLERTPGGAAAYATVGAAMSDVWVTLITLLGHDYPFERLRADLSARGNVDTSLVRWLPRPSIHDVAWYRADGSRTFDIADWAAMDELTPSIADVPASIVAGREGTHPAAPGTQLRVGSRMCEGGRGAHPRVSGPAGHGGADTPVPPCPPVALLTPCALTRQLELVRFLRGHNCPVAMDTEIHYFPTAAQRDTLREVVRHATYFLPSIEHLQLLYASSSSDPLDYAREIVGLGCPWVAVKQGRAGSTLFHCASGRRWHIPAVEDVAVRDTTGAGDAYCGGFVAALAEGRTPLEAACRGTVAASFSVECIGARMPAHFTPALAAERYNRLRARVRE